jgi:protocatechuate 3,4-dioxygenase beta subunit
MEIAETGKKLYSTAMKTAREKLVRTSIFIFACTLMSLAPACRTAADCPPTPPDMLGPFYKPDAPERSKVGEGYVLRGTVRSSRDCSTIQGAAIEFWLTGPDGDYDDDHRATVYSGGAGEYRFESNLPQTYYGRPAHIHMRISAPRFKTLVTQHYPEKGKNQGDFDIVLIPTHE